MVIGNHGWGSCFGQFSYRHLLVVASQEKKNKARNNHCWKYSSFRFNYVKCLDFFLIFTRFHTVISHQSLIMFPLKPQGMKKLRTMSVLINLVQRNSVIMHINSTKKKARMLPYPYTAMPVYQLQQTIFQKQMSWDKVDLAPFTR